MTPFEFIEALQKITIEKIREIGIKSVHENSEVVISDSIVANAEGLTFAGNRIDNNPPFSDWEETGEFHENLKFRSDDDIEFTSKGEGAEAVFNSFDHDDTIAPSAKTLDKSTLDDLRKLFIKNLQEQIQ